MTMEGDDDLPLAPPAEVTKPPDVLYRIARLPADPTAWPDAKYLSRAPAFRFDDPEREYLVVYAGEQPLACFLELLNRELPPVSVWREYLLRRRNAPAPAVAYDPTTLPGRWREQRQMGTFRLPDGKNWLDLRSPQTHEALRRALPTSVLADSNWLDGSDVITRGHTLTRVISRWAVFYQDCLIDPGAATPIAGDDSDFVQAKHLLGLR